MSFQNTKRVVLTLLLSLFIGPAHAEIPQEFSEFVSTYLASAFSDTRREILKPLGGLSLEHQRSFSKLWNEGPDALSTKTESEFEQLVSGFKLFAHIHMCDEIIAGMIKDEAAAALRTPRCWQGLYVK
jgi:hypothetical protein